MSLAVLLNPDDPTFNFEHMMQHRETFAVMNELNRFSALPYLLDPGIEQNIPATMWNTNHQQAHDDLNHTLPSNYENGYTITHVVPPVATATANSTGTNNLALTGVANTVMINAVVAGAGVPPGTTIVAQQSGATGSDGTYTTNLPTTLSNVAVTITHPPYEQANPLTAGTFGIPQSQILVEGTGQTPENRAWWTFANHQEHFTANAAILPLPTTAPTTAGTPPGVETVSSPWWWSQRAPVIFPYW